jgi:hypothetical protein
MTTGWNTSSSATKTILQNTTMTTPTEAAAEIFDIIGTIKRLTERKEELQAVISTAIDLGELDDSLMADDKGYALDGIRVCPVFRTTHKFFDEVEKKISVLKEQAMNQNKVIPKTSVSYRFTAIDAD